MTTTMPTIGRTLALATWFSVCECTCASAQIQPRSIDPKFILPASDEDMAKLRHDSTSKAEEHAWQILQAMIDLSGTSQPTWVTWQTQKEVFSQTPGSTPINSPQNEKTTRDQRLFFSPSSQIELDQKLHQLKGMNLEVERLRTDVVAPCEDDVIYVKPPIVSVLFNPAAASHILQREYNKKSTLLAMRKIGWPSIVEFPRDAIVIKAAWWPIAHDGLTPLPIWTFPLQDAKYTCEPSATPPACTNNGWLRWRRIVAIDPTPQNLNDNNTGRIVPWNPSAKRPLAPDKICDVSVLPVVPIDSFFTLNVHDFEPSSSDRAEIDGLFTTIIGRKSEPLDRVALVGLHVATKELPDWFWATFWWQEEAWTVNKPQVLQDDSVWSHYRVSTAMDITEPIDQNGREQPIIAFSPWLEALQNHGIESNCIACHQRACYSPDTRKDDSILLPLAKLPLSDPLFEKATRVDYIFSLRHEKLP